MKSTVRPLLLILSCICFSLLLKAQSDVKGSASDQKIHVLLLGTFHFNQTDSSYNVLTEEKQAEVAELVNRLSRFHPDKVFVERNPEFEYTNKIDSQYQQYKKGQFAIGKNEIYQVGFRLGKMLGHNTIYQCDHPGRYGYYYRIIRDYAGTHGQTDILQSKAMGTTLPMTSRINRDSLMKSTTLIQFLEWLNSKPVQESSQAFYINTFPRLGNVDVYHWTSDSNYFAGTELLADWYRRNIRIYSKILNQLDYSEKGIFLIIGNDHVPILRHLFESNPYFVVEDTEKWLEGKATATATVTEKGTGTVVIKCNQCGNKGEIDIERTDDSRMKKVFSFNNKPTSYRVYYREVLPAGTYSYSYTDNKKNKDEGTFSVKTEGTTTITLFEGQ